METELTNQVIEGLKIVGTIGGLTVITLSVLFGGVAGIMKLAERKHLLNTLRTHYEKGNLNRKPTYLNVGSFYER